MAHVLDLLLSNSDAEMLRRLLADHRRANPSEPDGSDRVAELMLDARFVADDAVPADCIGLGSTVTYRADGGTEYRTVTLVAPASAEPSAGRISVLSPIGLALIGRRRGAVSEAALPNGRVMKLRVLDAARARMPLKAAA